MHNIDTNTFCYNYHNFYYFYNEEEEEKKEEKENYLRVGKVS